MSSDDRLDRSAIDNLLASVGGDREFLIELIDTYFEDTVTLFGQMESALVTGDAPVLQRAAHSLKSNSANFGATQLSGMAKELEGMGKSGQTGAAHDLLQQAAAEYERVRTALEVVRNEG